MAKDNPTPKSGVLLRAFAERGMPWNELEIDSENDDLKLVGSLVRSGHIQAKDGARFEITAKGAAWLAKQGFDAPSERLTTDRQGFVTHIGGKPIV